MTNVTIDNSATEELGKVVLWQYDKAVNLIRILDYLGNWYTMGVDEFWNAYPSRVIGVDTADAFGLSVWGTFLGLPRPVYRVDASNKASISDDLYRRVLKARFYLMKSSASINGLAYYLSMLFDCRRYTGESGVFVTDLGDMAMSYSQNLNAPTLYLDGTSHRAGELLAVVTNYQVKSGKTIPDGTPWSKVVDDGLVEELPPAQQIVSDYAGGVSYASGDIITHGGLVYRCNSGFTSTTWGNDASSCTQIPCYVDPAQYADFAYQVGVAYSAADSDGNFADYVLHDYEVREGKPYGSKVYVCTANVTASVNTSWNAVSSSFSEISASYSSGSRLCRIQVMRVNEDIPFGSARTEVLDKSDEIPFRNSNVKTPLNVTYWDDMTKEQQLLFESANSVESTYLEDTDLDKARELLPFPAGIRFNTPYNEVVFGFAGQEPAAKAPPVGSFCEALSSVAAYPISGQTSYNKGAVFKDDDVVYYAKRYFGVGRSATDETSGADKRFIPAKQYETTGTYEPGDAVCNEAVTSSASYKIVTKRIGKSRPYLQEAGDGFLMLLKEGIYTDAATKSALSVAYVRMGKPQDDVGNTIDETVAESGIYLVDGIRYSSELSGNDRYETVAFRGKIGGVDKWTVYVSMPQTDQWIYQRDKEYEKDSVLRVATSSSSLSLEDVLGVVVIQIGNPGTYADCMDADRTRSYSGEINDYSQSSTYEVGSMMYTCSEDNSVYVCTRSVGSPRALATEISDGNVGEAWNDTTFISSYYPSRWESEISASTNA